MSGIAKNLAAAAAMALVAIAALFLLTEAHGGAVLYELRLEGESSGACFGFELGDSERFSVTFVHSVNKTPVTDVYEPVDGKIYAVESIYYGFGAGVLSELPEGARIEYAADGAMVVSGFKAEMQKLTYIVGSVSDHMLGIGGEEISLTGLFGKSEAVSFALYRLR